ncbi:T9SS type A sorting domain-containing protein, partial [Psychroserpens algicola]
AASGSCPEVSATVTVLYYDVTPDDTASGEVCEGNTFNYEGTEYEVGSHDIPRIDGNGCPYKTVLTVTAYPVTPDDTASGEVCEGNTYNYEGTEYSVGSHDIPRIDGNGCPYKTVLTVTSYEVTPDIEDIVTICKEDFYTWPVTNESYTATDSPVIVELIDDNGCTYTATLIINENAGLDAGENGTLTVCAGETPTEEELFGALQGSPDEGGIWTGPINGQYTYTFESNAGCIGSSAIVKVYEYDKTINVKEEVFVCQGSPYVWDLTGNKYSADDSPIILDLLDDNGCPYNATLIIYEYPQTENVIETVMLCETQTYTWDLDGNTYSIDESPITIKALDDNGCSYAATLILEDLLDETIDFNAPDFICVEDGIIHLTGGEPEGGVYSGIGVIDNLDGTYSLDTNELGVGKHVLSYTIGSKTKCEQSKKVKIDIVECCEDEKAYAYAPSAGIGYESCFLESEMLTELDWGWTNGNLDLQSTNELGYYNIYTFNLYAAGDDGTCNPSGQGTSAILVGSVTLEREGNNALVTYSINDEDSAFDYTLGNVNVYIGCNPYPCQSLNDDDGSSNRRLCASTIDVDEYPYSGYSEDGDTVTLTIPISDLNNFANCLDSFYMIAYAEVEICEVYEEDKDDDNQEFLSFSDKREALGIDFKAYPVPYKDVVNLAYEFNFKTNVAIEIMDIRGTSIIRITNDDYVKGSEGKTTIDLSDAKDQILFVRMTTSQGSVIKKIVSSNKK